MQVLIIYILLFANANLSKLECVKWEEAKNFDFYKLPRGVTAEKVKWSDLRNVQYVRINEARAILRNSTCKDTKMAIWKDEYLMVVEFLDGKKKRFKVSGYGGFLYEPGHRFYYITDGDRDKWQSIVENFKVRINN